MHMLEERKSEGSDELTLARDLSANLVTEGNRPVTRDRDNYHQPPTSSLSTSPSDASSRQR